ncbi:MAG: hypothetical protein K8R46_11720 [Pirellulales bacterium]|nr:hypothetical protein [Pirellulales bacterium]
MRTKLFSIGLLLIISGFFTACENSNMATDESSVQSYFLDDIQLLNTIDTKAGDRVDDGTPICSWIFSVNPQTDIAVIDGDLISIGMEPRSVLTAMTITIDQWPYNRDSDYFEYGPHGFVFQRSIEVGTALSYWDIPEGTDPDDITFFQIVEGPSGVDEFIEVPSEVEDSLLVGEYEHFSKYAVGVLPGSD